MGKPKSGKKTNSSSKGSDSPDGDVVGQGDRPGWPKVILSLAMGKSDSMYCLGCICIVSYTFRCHDMPSHLALPPSNHSIPIPFPIHYVHSIHMRYNLKSKVFYQVS